MLLARWLLFFLLGAVPFSARAQSGALPRVRGVRLLRLVDGHDRPLTGDCFAPHFAALGNGLWFTRLRNGARSLWFALPFVDARERYPAWRAVPLWEPSAPLVLGEAQPLGTDRETFVGTGFVGSVATLWRGEGAQVRALWSGGEPMSGLAPSPDGKTLVFTRTFRDTNGAALPQLWRIGVGGKDAKPVLVCKHARRAFWLDGDTLVFERLADKGGAFWTLDPFAASAPRLLLEGSGEGAALRGGAGLLFAAQMPGSQTSGLFCLARDGSGLRAIPATQGARRPAVSPDGARLSFDAPDPRTGARALWVGELDAAQGPLVRRPNPARGALCEGTASVATASPSVTSSPTPAPSATPTPSDDRADMDVAGTLANASRGAKMRVTLWAKNRGVRAWTPSDVRVVARWVDFEAGTRRRWEWKWMRATLKPLGQTRLPFELSVPTKAGRYKIIYGLLRLPPKGSRFSPPPYDAPQEAWPGEFAAIAFAVNVK